MVMNKDIWTLVLWSTVWSYREWGFLLCTTEVHFFKTTHGIYIRMTSSHTLCTDK